MRLDFANDEAVNRTPFFADGVLGAVRFARSAGAIHRPPRALCRPRAAGIVQTVHGNRFDRDKTLRRTYTTLARRAFGLRHELIAGFCP